MITPISSDTVVHNGPSRLWQSIGLDATTDEVDSLSSAYKRLELPILEECLLYSMQSLVRLDRLLDRLPSLFGKVRGVGSKALSLLIHGRAALEFGDVGILL